MEEEDEETKVEEDNPFKWWKEKDEDEDSMAEIRLPADDVQEDNVECKTCEPRGGIEGIKEISGGIAERAERIAGKRDDRKIINIGDPRQPTAGEIKEHELAGHLPYRNWCYHCVKGEGEGPGS